MEKLKNNKVLHVIGSILYYLLVILILAILIVVLLQRVSNNAMSIGGIRIFNIVSESMVPKYVIGDVLVAKSVDANELQVGDDIAYRGEVGSFNGKIITHEIIAIDKDGDTLKFHTKGINNDEEDPATVESNQIYGKIVYHTKLLSLISKIISNLYGFYFLIFVPITILIIIKIRDIYLSVRDKKDNKEEENDENKK